MPQELSLGDAVRQIASLVSDNKMPIPFQNEAPWHILFYRLKKQLSPPKPHFLDRLRFDSDGRYPKCRELSEFLRGLHTACSVNVPNPSYDEIVLPPEAKAEWDEERKDLRKEDEQFLANALVEAKKEFPKSSKRNAQKVS